MHTVFLAGSDPKHPRMIGGKGISSPEGSYIDKIRKSYLHHVSKAAWSPKKGYVLKYMDKLSITYDR